MCAIFPGSSFSLRITVDLRMTHSDARLPHTSGDEASDGRLDDARPHSAASGKAGGTASRKAGGAASFDRQARSLLTTQHLGRTMRTYDEVGSTNSVAAEWIEAGAPHGAVVVADHQTQGRGRLGRFWIAAAGLNLTFSVVLRPHLASDRLGLLTIAACTAVSRSVDRFVDPLRTSIKWPNDLILGHRKLCGMLLEASWSASGPYPPVVLGVGLNVNQIDFPEEIRDSATSILAETGRIVSRAELFAAVLSDLEDALLRLAENDEDVRREYTDRMMSINEQVSLRFAASDRRVEGRVRGIDASGGILLQTDSGSAVFHAGEVTRSD